MSSNSGRSVNYAVRPAKNVERKMIKDLFLRLRSFGELSEYQYIGFGAKYFVDFVMFHKHLHIKNMLSIEKDCNNIERYEFNRPYGCITIKNGQSNDILPTVGYEKNVVCWLDYDGCLADNALTDIAILLESARSGSAIAVSFNSNPYKALELKEKHGSNLTQAGLVLKELGEGIREEMLPTNLPNSGLFKATVFSKILRQIVFNQINKTLTNKNAGLGEEDKWIFSQIMYFDYKDGACMTTIGGVLYQQSDSHKFRCCDFESLDCYRSGDDSYSIDVPNLTMKEINRLHENMPLSRDGIDRSKLSEKVFSEKDILNFSKIYKYFPNFSEVEGA